MSCNHYMRWLPCYACGTLVLTTAPRVTCPECRAEVNRERSRARHKYQPDPDAYIVVYDPTPFDDGGYRPGVTSFDREQMRCMLLECCNGALAQGMILKNHADYYFRLVREGNKFKLIHTAHLCKT